MWIIGCDFHPRYQQIAALNQATGELVERRLSHEGKEAAAFYESLPRGALVGMEATCPAQWLERLLDRCGHALRVGDAAEIRASVVRKQKTDTRDARHLLDLLLTDRFPCVWMPTPAEAGCALACRRNFRGGGRALPTLSFRLSARFSGGSAVPMLLVRTQRRNPSVNCRRSRSR